MKDHGIELDDEEMHIMRLCLKYARCYDIYKCNDSEECKCKTDIIIERLKKKFGCD